MPNILHWMKSVYGTRQPVIGGKLFSFLEDNTWTSTESSLNFFFWSSVFQNNWLELVVWRTCPERSIDNMLIKMHLCICIIFMCSIIIINIRKVHTSVLWCRLIGEWSTSVWEVKAPFFSHISNIYIYCKYIIEDRGKFPALQHFINCF